MASIEADDAGGGVTTSYNPGWISPDQAVQLDEALAADLAEMAAMDNEPEAG